MNNNIINDLHSFCKQKNFIEGSVTITLEDLVDIANRDCRLNATPIKIDYKLQGLTDNVGHLFLSGEWQAHVDLNCSFCCQKMDYVLNQDYDKLRLIDETENSLDHEGETLECRFDRFKLKEWLFSEMMLTLPIAPRHPTTCVEWQSNETNQEQQVSKKIYEILTDNQNHR